MTDIVERLRNFGTDSEVGIWEMIDDAADTIETLRQQVKGLKEHNTELLEELHNCWKRIGELEGEPDAKTPYAPKPDRNTNDD